MVEIVRGTLENRAQIVDLLRRCFYRYEPLNISVGSMDGPASSQDVRSLQSLGQGLSLVAVGEGGSIVGVCLNGEIRRDEPKQAFPCKCVKYSQIVKVISKIAQRADVWQHTTSSRGMEFQVLAVDTQCRGQGLGRIMLEKTRELAREEGHGFITGTCTGAYSAHLPPLMGMACIYSVPYTQLVAEGLLPAVPPEPHQEIKVFYQCLTE